MEYLCRKSPWICSTCRKHFPVLSSFTGFVTIFTRRVPLVKQELLTLLEHLSSPPVLSGVRVMLCYSIFSFICYVVLLDLQFYVYVVLLDLQFYVLCCFTRSLVLCVMLFYSIFSFMCMFCRSLFVLLYFFFWPQCCLYFFDIRILVTPLISSNSSYCLVLYYVFPAQYAFTHVMYEHFLHNLDQLNIREYRRAIKKGRSRETGNIERTQTKEKHHKHNTICVGHHFTQTNTNT